MRKKTGKIFAAIAAISVAASAGALVACENSDEDKTPQGVYAVKFDANGGTFDANATTVLLRTVNGKLPTLPAEPTNGDFAFNGYTVNRDGTGDKITLDTVFSASTTVYAQWGGESGEPETEYTVTFDANGGEFADGATTSLTTSGGKLSAFVQNPFRDGYKFDGWYLVAEPAATDNALTLDYTYTADITVYANWADDSAPIDPVGVYEITFDGNGGKILGEDSVKLNTANGKLASLPADAVREGYNFIGWFSAATGGNKVTVATVYEAATTVYAQWTEKDPEVPDDGLNLHSFYLVGDMTEDWKILPEYELQDIALGENMTRQLSVKFTTTAENMKMKLWYHNGTEGGDWNTRVDEIYIGSKKLEADAKGNYIIPEAGTYTMYYKVYGEWVRIDLVKKPVLPDPSTLTVSLGDIDLIVNADNDSDDYIEFKTATGVELRANTKLALTVDSEATDVFVNGDSQGIDTSVTDKKVSEITIAARGTFTFFVKYDGNNWIVYSEFVEYEPEVSEPVDITFDAGEGTLATTTLKTDENGKLTELPTPTPPAGYDFVGWFFSQTGGTQITTATVFDEATTVYAQYRTATLKPTFKLNDKNTNPDYVEYMATGVSVKKGDEIEFIIDGETKTVTAKGAGVEQKGGKVTATRTGTFSFYVKNYKDNPTYWEVYATDGVNTNAYYLVGNMADSNWVWAEKYILSEDVPDNTGNTQYSITVELQANAEVRIWKSENHWYNNLKGDADGKITLVGNNMKVVEAGTYKFWFNSNQEIYVVAIVGELTITLDAGEGTLAGETTLKTDENGKLTELPTPTPPAGKRFKGWYTAATDGERVTTETAFKTATTIYAQYEDESAPPTLYTVTFDANGGTLDGETTAITDENGNLAELPTPTPPEGYEFVGWFTAMQSGDKVTVDYTFIADKTVYAIYEKIDTTPVVGMKVGDGEAVTVEYNTGAETEGSNLLYEYMMKKVALDKDDAVSFVVDGEALAEFYTDNIHGVTKVGNTLKVTETGEFDIYVRYYDTDPDTGKPPCWVIEMTDGKTDVLIDGAYYIAGTMNGWKATAGFDMQDGSVTLELTAGDEFKVMQHNGTDKYWYGYFSVQRGRSYVEDKGGNIMITASGTYTISLIGTVISITSEDVEEPEYTAMPNTYYLVGTITNWNIDPDYKYILTKNPSNDNEYMITITFDSAVTLKVRYGDNGWSGTNYEISEAGTYTIYFDTKSNEIVYAAKA